MWLSFPLRLPEAMPVKKRETKQHIEEDRESEHCYYCPLTLMVGPRLVGSGEAIYKAVGAHAPTKKLNTTK